MGPLFSASRFNSVQQCLNFLNCVFLLMGSYLSLSGSRIRVETHYFSLENTENGHGESEGCYLFITVTSLSAGSELGPTEGAGRVLANLQSP